MATRRGAAMGEERTSEVRSVENGILQRTSVSQVKTFEQCERLWYFVKVMRLPTKGTKKQDKGKIIHKQLEHYLKTGEDGLGPEAAAGKHLLPAPGKDLLVEDVRGLDNLLYADGVPFIGYIDLVNPRELPLVRVWDHKTTGNFKWAKTASELATDPQMVGYGEWARLKYPKATHVELAHIYYKTERPFDAKPVQITLPLDTVKRTWENKIVPIVKRMKVVAGVDDAENVKGHEITSDACNAYGGCPFKARCHSPEKRFLMSLRDSLLDTKPAPTAIPSNGIVPVQSPVGGGTIAPGANTLAGLRYSTQQQEILCVDEFGNPRRQLPIEDHLDEQLLPADAPKPDPIAATAALEVKKRGRRPKVESLGEGPPVAQVVAPEVKEKPVTSVSITAMTADKLYLYVDTVPSTPSQSLDAWVMGLAQKIAEKAGVPDIQFVTDKNNVLAFNGWKGALRAAALQNAPTGHCIIHETELAQPVIEALSLKAEIVVRRGGR